MRSSFFVHLIGVSLALGICAVGTGARAEEVATSPTEASVATTTVVVAVPERPHFFQMADGRWYHPGTGLTAPTEQALYNLLFPPAVPVDVATTTGETPTTTQPTPPLQEFPLVQAIRRGQELLREQLAHASGTYNVKPLAAKPDWAPVDLAVWRSGTDQIDVIHIEKRGTEIRGTDPRIGEVEVLFSRQLQSQYGLESAGDVVVAIRYPLYTEVTVAKKKKYKREDVIYSPYSPVLHTPEMVRFGQAWLDQAFQRIAEDLRARGIKSRLDPNRPLADMLSAEVARAILLIEHVDRPSLDQNPAATYARMLVTVAANATTSYAYSDSHVGAQGFAQFMPATYKLVAKDTALGLPASVEEGTRQFETAIKAELVYLDRLSAVMPEAAKLLTATNPDKAAEYIVAAYNGGEGRVTKASAVWEDAWTTPDLSIVKRAESALTSANAALKKAKKALTAATTAKAKTTAKAAVSKAQTAQANAQVKYDKLQAGTLRQETIDYVAKFRQALKGIRQVSAELLGLPSPAATILPAMTAPVSDSPQAVNMTATTSSAPTLVTQGSL